MHIRTRKKMFGLDTSCFQLTSILLSSDPALLRRPRLPARDMQYQTLEIDSTSGSTTDGRVDRPSLRGQCSGL